MIALGGPLSTGHGLTGLCAHLISGSVCMDFCPHVIQLSSSIPSLNPKKHRLVLWLVFSKSSAQIAPPSSSRHPSSLFAVEGRGL